MTIDIPYVEILSLTDQLVIKSLHLASFLLHCKRVDIKNIVCAYGQLPLYIDAEGKLTFSLPNMSDMSGLGKHTMFFYMDALIEHQLNVLNIEDDYSVTVYWTGGTISHPIDETKYLPKTYTLKDFISKYKRK